MRISKQDLNEFISCVNAVEGGLDFEEFCQLAKLIYRYNHRDLQASAQAWARLVHADVDEQVFMLLLTYDSKLDGNGTPKKQGWHPDGSFTSSKGQHYTKEQIQALAFADSLTLSCSSCHEEYEVDPEDDPFPCDCGEGMVSSVLHEMNQTG